MEVEWERWGGEEVGAAMGLLWEGNGMERRRDEVERKRWGGVEWGVELGDRRV